MKYCDNESKGNRCPIYGIKEELAEVVIFMLNRRSHPCKEFQGRNALAGSESSAHKVLRWKDSRGARGDEAPQMLSKTEYKEHSESALQVLKHCGKLNIQKY